MHSHTNIVTTNIRVTKVYKEMTEKHLIVIFQPCLESTGGTRRDMGAFWVNKDTRGALGNH